MKTLPVATLALFLVVSYCPAAWADRVEVKGIGTISQVEKATDSDKEKALLEAKKSAWKNYVTKQNQSQQQMIAKNDQHFAESLNKYIADVVILDTAVDPAAKTLTVVARVAFNDQAINNFLQEAAVGVGKAGARSSNSLFTFLFMARKQTSIKQFDARRTTVEETTTANTKAADGAQTQQTIQKKGGNTTRKEDEVEYAVSSNQDLDSAVGEILTSAGVEYVAYDDIVSNCKAPTPKSFQDDYVSADEMSPSTRGAVISAVRDCEVRYFASGTVDTGVAARDAVSGNQQVFVSVRAQLWDVSPKLPRKVGSVGPKQYSGLGPDQSIAAKNALALAAKDLAKGLVDQLNAKGIR